MKATRPTNVRQRDESGIALIMALILVVALGLIIGGIADLASGSFVTAYNLGQQRDLEANAESAATIALANQRYQYDSGVITTSTTHECMPSTAEFYPAAVGTSDRMTVFCNALSHSPGSANSRELQFWVCRASSSATSPPSSCQVALYAVVSYDDLPPDASPNADTCPTKPAPNTCGIAMTILTWDVRTADN